MKVGQTSCKGIPVSGDSPGSAVRQALCIWSRKTQKLCVWLCGVSSVGLSSSVSGKPKNQRQEYT